MSGPNYAVVKFGTSRYNKDISFCFSVYSNFEKMVSRYVNYY